MFVCFFNKGFEHSGLLHKCKSQSGNTFENHWAPSLTLSPVCESVFRTQTHLLGLMGPCIPHLVANSMLELQQHVNGGVS
jgi:hypothetical protein